MRIAGKIKRGGIIALQGDLGSGKTTFTQGLLKKLKVKGPYTSPTFLVIKHYKKKFPISKYQFPNKSKLPKSKIRDTRYQIQNIFHVDAYRVTTKDILKLGWKEIISNKKSIIVIEWADRIRKIIPRGSLWINFKFIDSDKREIRIT
jgi:tRNA threonylcarbamoyladenosine biosynthesis protein TsaE